MIDQALTIQSKTIFNPDRDTAKAKRAADKLIDIVKQNQWSINLGGKKDHLMYEAWQTVGKYFNVTVATKEAEPVEIAGIVGFKAMGYVIDNKTGIEVGHAEAYCMEDETNWDRKPHVNQYGKTIPGKPLFQLASMAQTRAGSKALRQMFGFVVALAGYNPTPAEEMTGNETTQTSEKPIATAKQTAFILKLLDEKGYPVNSIKVKYGVEVAELTGDKASKIIEDLIKAPHYVKKVVEGEIINNDEVEKGIAQMEHENA